MSSWNQANRGEKLGRFGEIERKLAKLSMTTFTYLSSSYLFYWTMLGVVTYGSPFLFNFEVLDSEQKFMDPEKTFIHILRS